LAQKSKAFDRALQVHIENEIYEQLNQTFERVQAEFEAQKELHNES
jgi:predicted RNA-binding protein YlxR (DUF448 family)